MYKHRSWLSADPIKSLLYDDIHPGCIFHEPYVHVHSSSLKALDSK